MCAIFGSYEEDEFFELAKLNSYRGSHSYSISYYDGKSIQLVDKGFGEMPKRSLDHRYYIIGHVQAPTTEADSMDNIHPAVDRGDMLWHNGIIKEHVVNELRARYKISETWDTAIILYLLNTGQFPNILSELDGSFACLWYGKYNPSLRLFRNDNSPMFVHGSTISSTKFKNSKELESNIVYEYNNGKWRETQYTFNTANTFYWSA